MARLCVYLSMKRNILFFTAFFAILSGTPQTFVPADTGSTVKFKIKNLGFATTGSFNGLQGAIQFDPANLAASFFDVSIDVNTINTGIEARDNHLRQAEYFHVEKYPRIKFVSEKISPSNKNGTLYVSGMLTIKDVTKEISFPFKATPQNGGYLFAGEFKINRRDFGVGGGSVTLADNLTVILSVVALPQ